MQKLLTILEHLGSLRFLAGSALLIPLLFCVVVCFVFVCPRHVSFVPIVTSVSALPILDCPNGFLKRLFSLTHNTMYIYSSWRKTKCHMYNILRVVLQKRTDSFNHYLDL